MTSTQPTHTQNFRSLWENLTDGKKRLLIRAFVDLYGSSRTLYRKINGEVRIRKSEEVFLLNHLTEKDGKNN